MVLTPLVVAYGGYKDESADWPRSNYSAPRNEASSKEFSFRLICPTANIGGVIGKGGMIISQIRQDSGAAIKVDSSSANGNDCVISISAKEMFEDAFSRQSMRLHAFSPGAVRKLKRILASFFYHTIACSNFSNWLSYWKRRFHNFRDEENHQSQHSRTVQRNLPKVASKDDEMVQVSGNLDVAKDALVQVTSRLRAGLFYKEGQGFLPAFLPVLPYLPVSSDGSVNLKYENQRC